MEQCKVVFLTNNFDFLGYNMETIYRGCGSISISAKNSNHVRLEDPVNKGIFHWFKTGQDTKYV